MLNDCCFVVVRLLVSGQIHCLEWLELWPGLEVIVCILQQWSGLCVTQSVYFNSSLASVSHNLYTSTAVWPPCHTVLHFNSSLASVSHSLYILTVVWPLCHSLYTSAAVWPPCHTVCILQQWSGLRVTQSVYFNSSLASVSYSLYTSTAVWPPCHPVCMFNSGLASVSHSLYT